MNSMAFRHFKQLRVILKSLKGGSTIASACAAAHIDTSTLWGWRKKNSRLDSLIEILIESRILAVEDALYKAALDGNTKAIEMFLCNRASDRWAHRNTLINNNNVISTRVENNNPAVRLTEEELDEFIEHAYQCNQQKKKNSLLQKELDQKKLDQKKDQS